MPRQGAIIGSALMVFAVAGCGSTRWNFLQGHTAPAKQVGELPSREALVAYLNDNASRVRSVRVGELDITASQGLQSFGLRGKMVVQKPRDFRMSADTLGNRVVDLGSNEKEFWYWISKADPPYQFYCNYQDLQEGKVRFMPVPFQPDWIMETMGLGPYGPAEKYVLEHDANSIRLVERTRSPQGRPVKKVIVMNRRPVAPPQPQVMQYLLIDEQTGKEICSAKIRDIQVDRGTGAILPRRLDLHWPEQRVKLALKLDETAVNPDLPQAAFIRQPLQGVRSFDLAQGNFGADGLRPAQGSVPR